MRIVALTESPAALAVCGFHHVVVAARVGLVHGRLKGKDKDAVPIIEDGTWPVMQISGMESRRASAMAVTRLVAPGPLQAIQTAGLPCVRAMP